MQTSNPPITPRLGTPAPSDPPKVSFTPEQVKEIVKEEVESALAKRAIEDDDPTKAHLRPDEDQQFSNFDKKLDVFGVDISDAIPGFTLRWINDERDRIPRSEMIGWTFVKRTEVALNEKVFPANKDMGDNIAVYVGGDEAGKPLRAFLMKIPNERFAQIMKRKHQQDDMIDDAIRRGAIGPALNNKGYAGTDQGQVKINYNPRQRATSS